MKKFSAFLLAVILAVSVFTGCGCRNSKPAQTTPTTVPATAPTTQPTVPPTTNAVPSTEATIEDGNGPLPTNATTGADGDTSEETTNEAESRSRIMPENTSPTTGVNSRTHRIMPNG